MSYKIELTNNFKKEAKKLLKKYASLRADLEKLGKQLAEKPTSGIHLGHDVYKIRLGITSIKLREVRRSQSHNFCENC